MPDARRAALVTGAREGLGAAIALELARDGFDVAVTELSTEPLARTVAAIEALGVRAPRVRHVYCLRCITCWKATLKC